MEKNRTEIIAKLAADMVPIPGKQYSICKYPVTQELWDAVMGDSPTFFNELDCPAYRVSWYRCKEFVAKLNALPEVVASDVVYRLPSAEEWDHACRAGSTGDYCRLADGTEITEATLNDVAWTVERSFSFPRPYPVGRKKPNAFGLYDMIGNVCELVTKDSDDKDDWVSCGGSCFCNPDCYKVGCHVERDEWEYCGLRLLSEKKRLSTQFCSKDDLRDNVIASHVMSAVTAATADPRWGELLAAFPKFAVHEGWAELGGHDWSEILGKHPEFADKCDKWDDLYGHQWVDILRNSGAALADKCDWTRFDCYDWMNLLCNCPEYAEHCDWSKLDYELMAEDGQLASLLDDQPQLAAKCDWSRIPRGQKAEILLEHPEFMQYTGMHQLIIELVCREFVELGRRIIPATDDADGPVTGARVSARDKRRLYAVMKDGGIVHGLSVRAVLDGKVVFEQGIDPENAKDVAFVDCGNLFDIAPPKKGRWLYGSECNDPTWLTPWQMIVPARFKFNPAKLTIPFYHARTSALSDVALLVPPEEIRYGKKRPNTSGEDTEEMDFVIAPQCDDAEDKTTTQSFWLENEDGPEKYDGPWAEDDGDGEFFDEKFHFVTI